VARDTSDGTDGITTGCPLDRVLGFLAQAWIADVVYALGGGPMHFGALRRALAGRVSARVLADRLRQLQALDLVSRRQRPDGRREVAYALTADGAALDAVLRRFEATLGAMPLPAALVARGAAPELGAARRQDNPP
jgi:DNA-binding HxlR family transcriptional regulator